MNIKLIKQKNFFLLMTGKLASLLGSNMQQFALSLYVLALTGSAAIFASILSVSIIPRLLLSPVAGVFGDWFDRKKTIILLDFINSVIIFIYSLIFIFKGSLSLTMVYILVILLEITEIFFHSAMTAVIPSIVKNDELIEANSFNTLVVNMGQLLAPVGAALIYNAFGLKIILIVNSISFFISAVSKIFIEIPGNHKKPQSIGYKSFKKDFIEGVDLIKENKLLSTIISIGTIINFCAAPLFSIGLLFVVKEILKATDFQFGLFQMVLSLSMIAAPLLGSRRIKNIKLGRLCYTSFLLVSILILVMSAVLSSFVLNISKSNLIPFVLLTIITFIMGIFITFVNIAIGTMMNQTVPIELMGRTSTVFNFAVTVFIPIGQMFFGYLYDVAEPGYVVLLSGLILLFAIKKYKYRLVQGDICNGETTGGIINEV